MARDFTNRLAFMRCSLCLRFRQDEMVVAIFKANPRFQNGTAPLTLAILSTNVSFCNINVGIFFPARIIRDPCRVFD
jgi:hypothetical protein